MDNKLEVYNTGGKSKSGHGGKMAYFRGFGYTFCNSWQTMNNENRLRWRCNYLNGKSCSAAIVTNDQFEVDMTHFGKKPPAHDHSSVTIAEKLTTAAMCAIKEIATSNPELTAGQVIDRVRNNVNAAVLDKFPSKNAQAISIQRSRKKVIDAPVNPTEINDLGEIPEEFSFRNKRDSFGGANVREKWLQSDNGFGNDRFLIFARPKFLRKLSASDQWFMDGTFGILPEVFGDNAQLLTIHARYQNSHHTIPCAYVVMQDKRQDTYERVFADLQRLTNFTNPRQLFVDFETAMINAAQNVFPGVEICACLVHLYRSWRRRLGKLGLQGVIDSNVEMNLQYAMIKALAFVPENELDATYLDLVQNKLNRQVLDPFLDYLEENYIGKLDQRTGIRGDGLYPRKIWNVYARTLLNDPRTNNSIEGYHHKLKLVMKHGHSTLWTFISMLREFDETIYSDLRQWDNGLEPPGRKLWMMVQARKLRLVNKWDEVTRIEYLRSIASTLDNDI